MLMEWENLDSDDEAYSDYEEVNEPSLALPAPGFRPKGLFFQPKKNRARQRWSAKKKVRIEQLQRSDWQGSQLHIQFETLQAPLSPEVVQFLDRRLGKAGFKSLKVLRTYDRPEQAIETFLARIEQLGIDRLRPLLGLGGEHLLQVYVSQKEQPLARRKAKLIEALKAYGPLRYSPYCCAGKHWQVAVVEAGDWSEQQHKRFREALSDLDELRFLAKTQAYRLRFKLDAL